MHDVTWDPAARIFSYAYSDDLSRVSKLPEIRRMLEDETVRKFASEKQEPLRVSVQGNKKQGFDGTFFRSGPGDRLKVRLEGKKVTVVRKAGA
jgi:hypothetical protein